MPFPASYKNPRLVNRYLTVNVPGRGDLALDLDTCLGISRGNFQWGGRGGFSNATGQSLSGSDLTGDITYNSRTVHAHIDLSERIRVINGKLVYAAPAVNSESTSTTTTPRSTAPITPSPSPRSPGSPPPPSYEATFAREFSEFKQSHKSSYTARSSSFFKFSVRDLRLNGSVLHAECRRAGHTEYFHSELDLNAHIGVIDGKLVWGREGFFSACKNVRIKEGFILSAECKTNAGDYVESSLDLSLKVTAENSELSTFFSEANWMKFRVVTEPDPIGVLGTLGDKATFKNAFSTLAQTTSEHVIAEMSQELSVAASRYVKDAVTDTVKAQVTSIVSKAVSTRVQEEIGKKVDEIFATARESVLKACYTMADEAANDVTLQYTESVVGPMEEKITENCNQLVQYALKEVSESAIGQFQERAEIMMEREIVGAGLRRAQTQARLLQMLVETVHVA
ncbi:hypothetical protein F5880DRAFT_1509457 [Lentinula raphanica]|nr:hypothetical protein F5880DRAFT_1509457 [Lentinula raphanica]